MKAENILIKARNFLVFQGDVEAIAAQSSKDLSRLIEQISGSLRYKSDYERLKDAEDRISSQFNLTLNKKRSYNSEIKQYKSQATEVQRFQKMIRERDDVVLKQFLWKLYHLEVSGNRLKNERDSYKQQLQSQEQEVTDFQKASFSVRAEYSVAHSKIQELENSLKKQERVLSDKKKSLLPIDEKISITEQTIKKCNERIHRIEVDYESQNETVKRLEKDRELVSSEKDSFEKEVEAQTRAAGLNLSENDNLEYENLKSQYAQATAEHQSDIDNYNRNLKTEEDKVKTLQSKFNQFKIQEGNLSAEVADLRSRVSTQKSRLDECNAEFTTKNKELTSQISERRQRNIREEKLQVKLQEITEYLMKYNAYTRENERDASLREEVAAMKRIYGSGVKGFVHELCRPKKKKHEVAVSTVLGKDYNSIIVDSFHTAQECIHHMREQRSGVATFIPLDSVSTQPINNRLRGISDHVNLAVDIIDYEPELESAINYVCGSTIVCDDLNVAKYVRWTKNIDVKAVTLDGSVIHKAGLMTGGRVEKQNTLQWNENEIAQARKKKDQYINELAELAKSKYSNQEEQLQADIDGLDMKMAVIRQEIHASESTYKGREAELMFAIKQIGELELSLKLAKDNLHRLETQFSTVKEQVERIEDSIFAGFAKKIGVDNIREYRLAQSTFINESSQKRLVFVNQISRLNKQLEFEMSRKTDTEKRIENLNNTTSRDGDFIEQLQQERQVLLSQIQQVENDIDEIRHNIADQQQDSSELIAMVNEKNSQLLSAQKKFDSIKKKIALLQEEIYKVTMGFMNTLRTCKIEGINLPLLSGSLNDLQLDDVSLGATEDVEKEEEEEEEEEEKDDDNGNGGLNTQKMETGVRNILKKIEIDFSDLDDDLKEKGDERTGEKIENHIQLLTVNLEKMIVNTRATERLDDAERRLREIDQDVEEGRVKSKKAKEAFEQVKRKRYELFSKAFNHISGQIDRIYKELTRTSTFPLGGTANLSLEDEIEPYSDGVNYHVMPPMKRFCDMELLSGGEKTMAALALLFAIHSYHPSPFFVLDEVDAALDNANVGNIARYIQRHAGPGFQFIVISLKNGLFENSQSLVGIYRDQEENSSRALTMNLQMYNVSARG